MKASNAASASRPGLGHPDVLQGALGLGLLALWEFVQARWPSCGPSSAVRAPLGQTSPAAFQKPSAPSATISSGWTAQAASLQVEQQRAPIMRTLAGAVGEADELLLALRRRADDDQDALLLVFQTGLQMDAVGPDVDIALGRQVALGPSGVVVATSRPSAGRWWSPTSRPRPCPARPPAPRRSRRSRRP